jgi:trans-2,3-dihydro-3-hydroxyanthranilate isomerase
MTREYAFVQVDVFTDRVFGGNPLAVVLDAGGLTDGEMQAVAREMNLSETTFVLPATRPECAATVRIFTPAREVAFAGYPTIGTTWVLATRGRLGGAARAALEEGIGPVTVELEGDPALPSFVWMRHRDATFGPEVPARAAIADALGLDEGDLLAGVPVCTGTTGSLFLYVPLRDRAVVDRAALDVAAMRRAVGEAPLPGRVPLHAGATGRGVLADVRAAHLRCSRGSGHGLGHRTARGLPRRARPRRGW